MHVCTYTYIFRQDLGKEIFDESAGNWSLVWKKGEVDIVFWGKYVH